MNDVELKPVDKYTMRSRLWAGSNGIIYRLLKNNTFKAYRPIKRPDGFTHIWDTDSRGRKGHYRKIATLVMDAFKPKSGCGGYDLYKDGDPYNNVPSNLYRGSFADKEADRMFHAENGIGNVRREVVER